MSALNSRENMIQYDCCCGPKAAVAASYVQLLWAICATIVALIALENVDFFSGMPESLELLISGLLYVPLIFMAEFSTIESERAVTYSIYVCSVLILIPLALTVHKGASVRNHKWLLPKMIFDVVNLALGVWYFFERINSVSEVPNSLFAFHIAGAAIPVILLLPITIVTVQSYRYLKLFCQMSHALGVKCTTYTIPDIDLSPYHFSKTFYLPEA